VAAGGLVGAGLGALATVNPEAAVALAGGLSFGNLLGSTLRQSSGSSGLNPCDGLIASQSAQSAASSAGGSGGSGPTLAGGGGVGVLALPVAGTAAGRLAAIPGASWTTGLEIALRLNFLYSSSGEGGDDGDEPTTQGYYREGKEHDDYEISFLEILRTEVEQPQSRGFENFIRRTQGRYNPEEWEYVMEKWGPPGMHHLDEQVTRQHYWRNTVTEEVWHHERLGD